VCEIALGNNFLGDPLSGMNSDGTVVINTGIFLTESHWVSSRSLGLLRLIAIIKLNESQEEMSATDMMWRRSRAAITLNILRADVSSRFRNTCIH